MLLCSDTQSILQLTHHLSKQFGHNAASLPHLALLAVGKVWDDAHNIACRGSLASIGHDQQLHNVVVDVPASIDSVSTST